MKNLRFNIAGSVDCDIDHPKHGTIPTTFNAEESQKVIDSGVDIAEYVEPVKTLDNVRAEREPLFSAHVDKYGGSWWSALTANQKEQVNTYRAELKDITTQDPTDVTWPTPPSF
jgi:hypothetical protein